MLPILIRLSADNDGTFASIEKTLDALERLRVDYRRILVFSYLTIGIENFVSVKNPESDIGVVRIRTIRTVRQVRQQVCLGMTWAQGCNQERYRFGRR